MAELADALDLGSSAVKGVQVQVLFPAPHHESSPLSGELQTALHVVRQTSIQQFLCPVFVSQPRVLANPTLRTILSVRDCIVS